MRNPIRKIGDSLGLDFDTSIAGMTNRREILATKQVCKLWVGGFATFSALTGAALTNMGGHVEIEPQTTSGEIAEGVIEIGVQAPLIVAFSIAACGLAEGIRMHRLANQRLRELDSTELL